MRRARNRLYSDNSVISPHGKPPMNNPLEAKGFCLLCGRRLTSNESKVRGYGKLCYLKAQRQRQLF